MQVLLSALIKVGGLGLHVGAEAVPPVLRKLADEPVQTFGLTLLFVALTVNWHEKVVPPLE